MRRRHLLIDGALALALMVSAVLTVGTERPVAALVSAFWMSAVAWRTVSPPAMALTASAGAIAYALLPGEPTTPLWAFITVLVVSFTITAGLDGRRAIGWLGVLLISSCALAASATNDEDPLVPRVLTVLAIVGAPATAGWLVRRSRDQAAELRRIGAELAAEREAHAAIAAAQERNRIAGDLDEVITRTVSAMVVQAARAEQLLTRDDPAREPLRVVGETGRAALEDLAHQLRVIGREAQRPVPGLSDAITLARSSGAEVSHDDLAGVAAGPGLAAFRVVQEGLTNARKHAEGAPVRVRIVHADEGLVVEVVNGAGGRWSGPVVGGHGLNGMRERVSLYAGAVQAGPTAEGGWATRAVFPLAGPYEQPRLEAAR